MSMKYRILLSLPLAAALMVPAMAQQNNANPTDQNPPAVSDTNQGQTATQTGSASDQALPPLAPEPHEGFWGKLNPLARKKYVQRQVQPIRDRVNELDDLTAANSRDIKDTDSRAQAGIRLASAKADQADQHAVDAGNRAQQANQLATQANTRLNNVQQVVDNLDTYQPITEADIRLKPGQAALSQKAKDALDQIADSVKGQKGYIIEVQGFSSGSGQTAIQNSQRMAQSVVRYMVLKHEIPVYRIYLLGMGNAPVQATTQRASTRPISGGRVQVSLLKNNVDQLAGTSNAGAMDSGSQGGMSGTSSQPATPSTQPSNSTSDTERPTSNMGAAPQR
jgi:outer membrane protein OmpA-like peptidoglycan-associated protein